MGRSFTSDTKDPMFGSKHLQNIFIGDGLLRLVRILPKQSGLKPSRLEVELACEWTGRPGHKYKLTPSKARVKYFHKLESVFNGKKGSA